MSHLPKTLLFTGVLITAATVLSACNAKSSVTDPYSSEQQSLGTLASTTPQSQPPSNQQTNILERTEIPMKTLADFEKIAAQQATLTTTKGDITFELYRDQAPLTTANFLSLAKSGFYDGIVFHRVIPEFMAQVGDPLTKQTEMKAAWGTGGPGYTIADEFGPDLQHDTEGIVSMANAGPNTGGSQFFITYEATPHLNGKHAVFGKVTKGMDILQKITIGDKILKVTYQ